ncbi:oleosin-like [Cynara cardunculus var. scolymus]|uniref:Oleosin n=1 Tax=Cynara cardunculus var. scolymus TaxID=59895 RepID=A0A103Y4Q0_CYNCS|nr:oleosin-like [Cynara cardunculus var. scolymus]KVI02467.1 Oleosin [Cynara cardunculus var. scolymus]
MATTYDRHTQHTAGAGPGPGPGRYDRTDDRLVGPYYYKQQQGPSGSKILAIITMLPVGAIFLGLSGLTFVGTLIGLAVATPLFVIFSPVIVPAILTIGLAVTGFLTSGTFGLTGLSSLSYMVNMLRQTAATVPENVDYLKGRISDVGMYAGQKTKEAGQNIQHKAHEMGTDRDRDREGRAGVQVQAGAGAGGGVAGGGKEGGKGGDRT